jgi:hypothetical protein
VCSYACLSPIFLVNYFPGRLYKSLTPWRPYLTIFDNQVLATNSLAEPILFCSLIIINVDGRSKKEFFLFIRARQFSPCLCALTGIDLKFLEFGNCIRPNYFLLLFFIVTFLVTFHFPLHDLRFIHIWECPTIHGSLR